MNSKEALELVSNRLNWESRLFVDELNIIKKDLDRLEKLEEENASLRSENEILKKSIENSNKSYDILMQNSNIQFLNQNQEIFKLKKVIEILKRFVTISYCRNEETNKWDIPLMYSFGFSEKLTQEEYDLLKGAFWK